MTKIEHLQFLVLMVPTFLILAAAAVSMADLAMPANAQPYLAASANTSAAADMVWDDRPAN